MVTLLPPFLMIFNMIAVYWFIKWRPMAISVVAYEGVVSVVLNIVYVQIVYSLIRLSVCYRFDDGKAWMWYGMSKYSPLFKCLA